MAQSYVTDSGVLLINPGTYVTVTVQPGSAAIAAAGVVTLIGEADQGPGWTAESDITQNYFSPSQYGAILAKYQSGRIVDAAKQLINAANDPSITGSINLIRIIKTNPSSPAYATFKRNGFGSFATITADIPGAPGNLITYQSAVAQAEVAPSTGSFAYCPIQTGSVSFNLRTNGGTQESITVSAFEPPNVLQSAIENYTNGIMCTGGQQKLVVPASGLTLTAAVTTNPNQLIVTLPPGSLWNASPVAGDTCVIPATGQYGAAQNSCIAGTGQANVGTYIVTGVTNTLVSASLTLLKISGTTPCVAASGSTDTDLTDIIDYADMTIQNMTGQDRQALVGLYGTFNTTLNDGLNVIMDAPAGQSWAAQPLPGDIVLFPALFAGVNPGFYQCISATASTVTFTRLSNGSSGTGIGSGSAGTALNPITQSTQPFFDEKAVIDGLGKSLAVEGNVTSIFFVPSSQQPVAFSNSLLVSAAEYENSFTVSQNSITDTFTAGGQVALLIGCTQQLATVQITPTALNFSVNGVAVFSAAMAQYPTLAQLANFISSQTTFSAQVAVSNLNNTASSALDEGTFGITGQAGVFAGRIKQDAVDWLEAVNQSPLVTVTLNTFSGLPDPISPMQFLMNGAKNGTTSAAVTAAIDACQGITTNFIVSLFSQDASKDVTQNLTDPSSTYVNSAINSYLGAHVIFMSTTQMRQNRIGFGSNLDTYANDKIAAGNIASFRMAMTIQSIKQTNSQGNPYTFQPWFAAVTAAGMQAAAGYKGIVKKFAQITGFVNPVGFNSQNPGQTADALQAGLMFLESVTTGGYRWTSDQLTYDVDNNFVYNSLQAVYVSDLIVLSLIDTYDRLVVGQSVADMTASAALSILDSEMFNFKRLKWIAASTDAPKGYKGASANLVGGVMNINAEIKLAGLIYFVPIGLLISPVEQSASSASGS